MWPTEDKATEEEPARQERHKDTCICPSFPACTLPGKEGGVEAREMIRMTPPCRQPGSSRQEGRCQRHHGSWCTLSLAPRTTCYLTGPSMYIHPFSSETPLTRTEVIVSTKDINSMPKVTQRKIWDLDTRILTWSPTCPSVITRYSHLDKQASGTSLGWAAGSPGF